MSVNNALLEQIVNDLCVSETTINEDVSKQASLYFYYAMCWLEAQKRMLLEKMDLDVFVAKEKKRLREKLLEESKKVTEGLLEEEVYSSDEYKSRMERFIQAKNEEAFWQVVKEAFKQRKDMIESLVNVVMVLSRGEEYVKEEDVNKIREKIKAKIKQKLLNSVKNNFEGSAE